uniref:Transmembrane protein 267 n=1 Tax=Callorhinchus milii TaxID=7868 RepID=A0A4W3HLC8_CALMI
TAVPQTTENARALLKTFSTASVIWSIGLGVFCFLSDQCLQLPLIQNNYWLRALSDNAVHGAVGLWSWAIVVGLKKRSDLYEVVLAGLLSSAVDADHFLAAGSLSLKAALLLPQRPPLHCSTVIPVVAFSMRLFMWLFRLKDSWCFLPWMVTISWVSHHIRDGARRGLWFCPFGNTAPVPYWLYIAITSSFPHLCSVLMYLTGTRETMSMSHGIAIDV